MTDLLPGDPSYAPMIFHQGRPSTIPNPKYRHAHADKTGKLVLRRTGLTKLSSYLVFGQSGPQQLKAV